MYANEVHLDEKSSEFRIKARPPPASVRSHPIGKFVKLVLKSQNGECPITCTSNVLASLVFMGQATDHEIANSLKA